MIWLFANAFLLGIVLVGALWLWLLGWAMYGLGLPPDDHPFVLALGTLACLWLTYFCAHRWHRIIAKLLS
jgi:hypothetical protein